MGEEKRREEKSKVFNVRKKIKIKIKIKRRIKSKKCDNEF